MITESECRPVAIFDSNTKTPSYMESKTHGNRNYDSNNVENFADFETMNIEQKSHGLCEFQRRSSEMNFTMDRNEFRNALKVLGRTHSLDSNMKSDIMDLDSLLKGKETNNFEVVKSKVNDTSDIKELDSFEDEPVKSKCKGYEESDVEDRDFDRIVNRSFYESKLKQFRNYRDSIKEFDDECKHQESCSAVDYDLGGCTTGDEEWDSDGRPTGERWPPLGAPNDDEDNQSLYSYSEFSWNRTSNDKSCEEERLKQLEEEQEQLNNSLMALTSHFAQVQFRLKQIVDASPEEKENLLQELEEFANRGIPDLREATASRRDSEHDCNEDTVGMDRQKELIEKLKQQLEDLETYAYQTGEGGPPQSKVMEKQRVVIEQLKGKLNLNVDEFDKLTVDDLRTQVDHAIRELVNPLKMKEQLVAQLQTQIIDLERFIKFLQVGEGEESEVPSLKKKCQCTEAPQRYPGDGRPQEAERRKGKTGPPQTNFTRTKNEQEQLRKETENIVKRATMLLNMLSFGCGPNPAKFQKNTLKKTPQGNHYGDLRAALEIAINNILEILRPETPADSDYTSDSEETPVMAYHEELTIAVRKQLAPALRDLIQHGLMPVGQSQSLVPFLSCFPQRSQKATKLMHAWDLILKYYHMKKGDQYNRTPARRLSQSFNLEIHGGSAITNKQSLLTVIGNVIASHTPLKRSHDSHFKAFVCAALNQKKLITWLRLIFRTQILTENYYQSWSYISKTGFEDAFRSLEKLNKYNLELPIDLAVRPFQNIKDAF